jgi:hypothetical protein
MPTADVVRYLADVLGYELLAYITGKSTKTVRRWAEETTSPRLGTEQILQATAYVFQTILESDSDHVARAWFIGLNPQLDDATPADMLRDGKVNAVVTAAKAFVSGG